MDGSCSRNKTTYVELKIREYDVCLEISIVAGRSSVESVDLGYFAEHVRQDITGVQHLQANLARTDHAHRGHGEAKDQRSSKE